MNVASTVMAAGTRLGRYEIIAHLASGGMANVYLARMGGAEGFHRLVAIKRLHAHIAGDEQFVAMFMDEARLAAQIRHPNVVPMLDLENGEHGPYLAMELIEGDSLLGLLKAEATADDDIPSPIVLRIMIDVLRGLDAAHELKSESGDLLHLVHRDVSPHNILVGVDGVARITDFGVARAEERSSHSRTGQIKGKLAYMAPEMTTAEPFDRRADVFAAGIVLWECLSGRRLFKGASDAEILRALLEGPIPRLRNVSPQYPDALDTVLQRALERDPARRWATAAEFADAIEEASTDVGIASQRGLASYVKRVAAERIEQLRTTVREWADGSARTLAIAAFQSRDDGEASTRVTTGAVVKPVGSAPPARRAVVVGLIGVGLVALGVVATLVATGASGEPRASQSNHADPPMKQAVSASQASAPLPLPSDDHIPTLDLTDTPDTKPQAKPRASAIVTSPHPARP